MNVLDLFSGIGGFSLGLERAGMQTVGFCEIEDYPRKVLAKHWPGVTIHRDITELDGRQYRGTVDLVCGGFPCQPFSVAGKQRGDRDDRHLWPEMLRVIREVQPAWVIGENVIGLEGLALDQCVSDLESNGFSVQTFDIPACGIGAIHRRHRLWIVAHANSDRLRKQQKRQRGQCSTAQFANDGAARDVADTDSDRSQGQRSNGDKKRWQKQDQRQAGLRHRAANAADTEGAGKRQTYRPRPGVSLQSGGSISATLGWPTEPPVCGADDGVPNRVDRLRALGNAVVPQVVEQIGLAILNTGKARC